MPSHLTNLLEFLDGGIVAKGRDATLADFGIAVENGREIYLDATILWSHATRYLTCAPSYGSE